MEMFYVAFVFVHFVALTARDDFVAWLTTEVIDS